MLRCSILDGAGLFANLEAKLINILDAVGSLETVPSTDAAGGAAGVGKDGGRPSMGRRQGGGRSQKQGGGGSGERGAWGGQAGGADGTAGGGGLSQLLRDEKSLEALQSASEEDLLTALRARRGTGEVLPGQAEKAKVKGPWRELPEWTQRTQRHRQAGSEEDTPRSERGRTPHSDSEFSVHSDDDEYEKEPVIQLGVPHMFGDKTSLYGTNVEAKDTGAVLIPEGVDWLLESPRAGEDHLAAALPRKAVVSDAYQPHDLLGAQNADDVSAGQSESSGACAPLQ